MPACRFECAPVTWVPGTSERGSCSSQPDMQTLTSSDWRAASEESVRRLAAGDWRDTDRRLRNLIAAPMLPTLRATDGERGGRGDSGSRQGGPNIRTALLPTMRASDFRSGSTSTATAEKNARPLAEVIVGCREQRETLINPEWAEAFMGFPVTWTHPR